MKKDIFEEMAKDVVESCKGKEGNLCLEVNRNTKQDKETSFYETVACVYCDKLAYSEDGELQGFDKQGKIIGSISHKILTKNYDVLSVSQNGVYIGGFDMDTHTESVVEYEKNLEKLNSIIESMNDDERKELEAFLESNAPAVEENKDEIVEQ